MKTHTDKPKKDNSSADINNFSGQQGSGEYAVDNRPQAAAGKALTDQVNSSFHVQQSKALQAMVDNSSRVARLQYSLPLQHPGMLSAPVIQRVTADQEKRFKTILELAKNDKKRGAALTQINLLLTSLEADKSSAADTMRVKLQELRTTINQQSGTHKSSNKLVPPKSTDTKTPPPGKLKTISKDTSKSTATTPGKGKTPVKKNISPAPAKQVPAQPVKKEEKKVNLTGGKKTADPKLFMEFVQHLYGYLETIGPFKEEDKAALTKEIKADIGSSFSLPDEELTAAANNIIGALIFQQDDIFSEFVSQDDLLAEHQLQTHSTRGDGNCSIHALLGEENADGTLVCDNAQEIRIKHANAYSNDQLSPHAKERMDAARENTIRHFSERLLKDYASDKPFIVPERKESKDKDHAEQQPSFSQVQKRLLEAIHLANTGGYEAGIQRNVTESTFDNVLEGVTGQNIFAELVGSGVLTKEGAVINPGITVHDISGVLPFPMQGKAPAIFELLKPYIKGKINSKPFVEKALADPDVKEAYLALLKHQHHWLNAEQLEALAYEHGKSLQLFENDLMGGLQVTDTVNAGEGRPLVRIYSSGTHFERLDPLTASTPSDNAGKAGVSPAQPGDAFQEGMYARGRAQYHSPFSAASNKKRTTADYRARYAHGLGHGIRISASVLKLVNTISQSGTLKIKFKTDQEHLMALSMAALWHDAANKAEDDKLAENKQGELFEKTVTANSVKTPPDPSKKAAYTWATACLKLKGAISHSGKQWNDMSAEEQGAAIIAGADSYEYVRSYKHMQKRYAPEKNILVKSGAMSPENDKEHFKAVMELILDTAGNTGGAQTPYPRPHKVSGDFEFRGIDAVKDPKSPLHTAFEKFATGVPEKSPADILSILYGFSSSSSASEVPETATKSGQKQGGRKDNTTNNAGKRVIKFFPRDRHRKPIRNEIPKDGGFFTQGVAPGFKKLPGNTVKPPDVNADQALALVHGIHADHVAGAFKNGFLSSAYMREGPYGKYSRPADKTGGGGLGVYTRAVGKAHTRWPAHGQGVGSGDAKIQIVLDPKILTSDAVWRHSSTDLMGNTPGGKAARSSRQGNQLDSFDLWEQQSEAERNDTFNKNISSPGSSGFSGNEQMFWERIPLKGNVTAIICKTAKQQEKIIRELGGNPEEGYVIYGGQQIPVIISGKDDTLADALDSKK